MAFASPNLPAVLAHSRALITSLQAPGGAYPASPTFSAYQGYSWFRDGAFIADGVSAAGEAGSASAFFDWCAAVVLRHRARIEDVVSAAAAGAPVPGTAMLPARFTLDGDLGQDEWWDFQLDGYGTWLWAVVEHARRHGLDLGRWQPAIALTVDYLTSSWQRPCYDWWEEHHEQVHVSTLGCIAAGLRAVLDAGVLDDSRGDAARAAVAGIGDLLASRGTADGHLTKWLGSDATDGSLTALVAPLALVPATSDLGRATVAAVEADLLAGGGVYRFRADTFYGGGRWPLLTCFLGLARNAAGDRGGALECLAWAVD
ncbi:MAG: glycoside hydrolase family 15 protein, partial [Propionicimonas sp.]|nr:glycoside hydrolase family 15 protein [Propionicimonas sp.]